MWPVRRGDITMSEWLKKWVIRFDALTLRERGLIGLVVFAVIVVIWQTLLLAPLDVRSRHINDALNHQQKLLNGLNLQIQALLARQSRDPNKPLREQQLRLEAQIARVNRQLREKMQGLIAPAQMAQVLEQVLAHDTHLTLVRVKSLPARPLLAPAQRVATRPETVSHPVSRSASSSSSTGVPAGQEIGVYRHGLVIEFRGSYLDTLAYLRALQALPWAFYWDSVQLDVVHYPQARVVITVHTLSLNKGWIGV